MTEKEKTAPNELAATSPEQSSTDKSIITNSDKKVKWLSDEKKIDEPLFCKNFCERSELRYIDGQFYSIDGMENHTKIRSEIARLLEANGVTSGIAKKTNSLFDALALFCHSAPIKPRDDEIHVLNGVIKVDGKIGEPPTFIPEKRFCVNRLCVEYDPDIWKHCYYPGHFMDFLVQQYYGNVHRRSVFRSHYCVLYVTYPIPFLSICDLTTNEMNNSQSFYC